MEENKTWESSDIIQCIEQAPKEVQTMVAKAFIRDDINNDDIQYLFNTDSIEDMNEDPTVENADAEAPEGIGASGFIMRTYKPENGNKNYNTKSVGGWSSCIKGNPMDSNANVLANCVGYASGRFNEIINLARETEGCAYNNLTCNAFRFKEKAESDGLETGSEPRLGAIMCWDKNGGAGHVAVVERVNDDGSVYRSESNYGGTSFLNKTCNNSNGRWGLSSGYNFRCFIYLPSDVQSIIEPAPEPAPAPVEPAPAPTPAPVEPAPAPVEPTPAVVPDNSLKVGDTVKIVGTGNGSSYGGRNTAYGIGWNRQILRIWDGRPYPYQVGKGTQTTGFYKENALQRV